MRVLFSRSSSNGGSKILECAKERLLADEAHMEVDALVDLVEQRQS